MRTSNIRCAALVVATALSLSASAQKNVLKAFEKFKKSSGVTVMNSTSSSGSDKFGWQCNAVAVEFKVADGAGTAPAWQTAKMQALQKAFEKDARGKNMTYFAQLKALDENATETEVAKRNKVVVRYNVEATPVVLGANISSNVLVLRCKAKRGGDDIVVALEWRQDGQKGVAGTFYEIEGRRNNMQVSLVSPAKEEKNNILARMNFYRENYTGEQTTANNALLLNMLEYLSTGVTNATEQEKTVAKTMMQVMGKESATETQKGIILQCVQALDKLPLKAPMGIASGDEIVARLESYHKEWNGTGIYPARQEVLRRMADYLRKQTLDARTFKTVHEGLLRWQGATGVDAERQFITNLVAELERKYDDEQLRK